MLSLGDNSMNFCAFPDLTQQTMRRNRWTSIDNIVVKPKIIGSQKFQYFQNEDKRGKDFVRKNKPQLLVQYMSD